jgi:hypothetical protein
MNGVTELPVLIENAAKWMDAWRLPFCRLVYSIADGVTTVLMGGRVRVGTAIWLLQGDVYETGRVQRCQSLPDGCGFELTVVPLKSQRAWNHGFEWPAHFSSQLEMAR